MTRTTELLKGCRKVIDNLICGETFCDRNISEKKWLCPVCKSELRGRLDVLKEEVKGKKQDYEDWRWVYLTANEGRIKINAEKIMNKKSEELASIQEEIKLIETAGVGK